ncbi:hypothetical protein [Spirosoma sordidisoli]|uniref:Uncharacterized protein n=1 Tax=Spirosoma sordidisoli TaxID=2502893 RepID=A0A4Q2ULY5_9BACT|nr:hypothetical protein [Spirosoma sordidisoli]RYC69752.1 hypothetical protein EQG79_14245 [Spirosoma sordidisoli]
MAIYQQETTERRHWRIAALLTALCMLIVLGLATSCKKAPPAPPVVTTIYADTARTRLLHRAEESGKAVIIIHERNQKTVADYEKSVSAFDSIRVTLP